MEEARRLLERLDRIETLDRAHAEPRELLGELRALLHEAEAWSRAEGAGGAEVGALREALARDMIAV